MVVLCISQSVSALFLPINSLFTVSKFTGPKILLYSGSPDPDLFCLWFICPYHIYLVRRQAAGSDLDPYPDYSIHAIRWFLRQPG